MSTTALTFARSVDPVTVDYLAQIGQLCLQELTLVDVERQTALCQPVENST